MPGEVAQRSRAPHANAEDPGSIPGTRVVVPRPFLTPVLGDLVLSSGPQGHCMHEVHRHTDQNTHTHKIKQRRVPHKKSGATVYIIHPLGGGSQHKPVMKGSEDV